LLIAFTISTFQEEETHTIVFSIILSAKFGSFACALVLCCGRRRPYSPLQIKLEFLQATFRRPRPRRGLHELAMQLEAFSMMSLSENNFKPCIWANFLQPTRPIPCRWSSLRAWPLMPCSPNCLPYTPSQTEQHTPFPATSLVWRQRSRTSTVLTRSSAMLPAHIACSRVL
jgi:hypothetical protein